MRIARTAVSAALVAAVCVLGWSRSAVACPFCSAPSLTMTEQVVQNDVVVLVKNGTATLYEDVEEGIVAYQGNAESLMRRKRRWIAKQRGTLAQPSGPSARTEAARIEPLVV